ncbi:hypothetical protein WDU94_008797 [Cyamophila willieti]
MSTFLSKILSSTISPKLRSLRFYEFFYTTPTQDTTQNTEQSNTQSTEQSNTQSTLVHTQNTEDPEDKNEESANISKSAELQTENQTPISSLSLQNNMSTQENSKNSSSCQNNSNTNEINMDNQEVRLVDIENRLNSLESCIGEADNEYGIIEGNNINLDTNDTESSPIYHQWRLSCYQ